MDLNQLFFHHQVALIGAQNGRSVEKRRWAAQCADYFARRIRGGAGRYPLMAASVAP